MEVTDEFIHFFASNCSTEIYQSENKAANFTILLDKPLYFENPEEWEVGLLHILLPKLYYNIYEPFNKNILEIRRFQDENEPESKSVLVCKVDVEPGFYSVKQFCDQVNNMSRRCLENSLKDTVPLLKNEDGSYFIEGSSPPKKKSRREHSTHETVGYSMDGEIYSNKRVYEMIKHVEDIDQRTIFERKLAARGVGTAQDPHATEHLSQQPASSSSIGARIKRSLHQEGLDVKSWNTTTQKLKALLLPKGNEKKVQFELFKVKPQSNKLKLNLLPKHFVKCPNVRMQKLLGWCRIDDVLSSTAYIVKPNMVKYTEEGEIDVTYSESSEIYGNFKEDKLFHILLPLSADFGRDNRALFLYTNIIQPSRVGNALAPLLKVIDLNSSNNGAEQIIVREYDAPVFYSIKGQMIDKVEFRMCNGLGEDFPFQQGEHSIVALKFRRLVKKKSY